MTRVIFILLIFFSYHLFSKPLSVLMHDSVSRKSISFSTIYDQAIDQPSELHRSLLRTVSNNDQELNTRKLAFSISNIHVNDQKIVRSKPIVNGIEIEGADGVYSLGRNSYHFEYTNFLGPKADFRLDAAEAILEALKVSPHSLLKNPYVENIKGVFTPIWLMHFDELRPSYKIRLPTLALVDLMDIYVAGDTGEILKMEPSAQFVRGMADVFVFSPKTKPPQKNELQQISLNNLLSIEEGGNLNGKYLDVRTCCRFYTCPESGPCNEQTKRCALESHKNAQQHRELIELSTGSLGLDPTLSLADKIYVDTARCTYLPFARASYRKDGNVLGFFDEPVDGPDLLSEMDRFSEIQAYFSVMSFFNNIRTLLNDKTWCLREQAMSCDSEGNIMLDEQGVPINRYRVFVNQLTPDLKMDSLNERAQDNLLNQLLSGKGSKEQPVVINSLKRMGNAAFIPALSTLKKTTPRADEILSDLIKPYDHNVFFQGIRDFAYDGDVVFHEFMHAVTTTLVGKLNSLGLDQWGINSEPGSLNEGWADYFAGAFTGDSVIGEYATTEGGLGEAGLRDINNNFSCPQNVIGEIHNDSKIWSGALWEIRSLVQKAMGNEAATEFDRTVLASLAKAESTENFKTQSETLMKTIKEWPAFGEKIASIAHNVLERRGLNNCFRAFTLSQVDKKNQVLKQNKALMFVPSKNTIGLKNYAPANSQLEIGIPAAATSMTISFRQLSGAGVAIGEETSDLKNIKPLGVIASFDKPLVWKFEQSYSIPTDGDEKIAFDEEDQNNFAKFDNGYWYLTKPLDLSLCEQKNMYISFLSYDFQYILEEIKVDFTIDHSKDLSRCEFKGSLRGILIDDDIAQGCSMISTSAHVELIILLAVFLFRRRKVNG